jgi:hypothetical protein
MIEIETLDFDSNARDDGDLEFEAVRSNRATTLL